MSPDRWRAVDAIRQAALDRVPDARAAFVAEACGDDDELRREVESLLAADTDSDFLERPAALPDTSSRLAAALARRYTLGRELGRGGMATVYAAEDLKHQRSVAIKVLHAELGAAIGAERFLREIAVTAKLHHPHILPLHDSGQAAGVVYYVMPLVEGETLRARLTRERQLPVGDALKIAREVASALDYAHRHGVIHRDIKPENILLQDGNALVADFGIALAVTDAGPDRVTQTGLSVGTPQYMAPEQALGERTLDARVDVYALGVVLFEMLAGEPPLPATSAQAIISRRLTEAAPPLRTLRRGVPPTVEAAVACALERTPADRFATVADFQRALDAYTPSSRRRLPLRARRAATFIGLAAIVAVAGVLARTIGWGAAGARPRAAAPPPAGPRGTHDSAAYSLVARAQVQADRRGAENLARSIALYKEALARDSNYADAWAGLARALSFSNIWRYPLGGVGIPADSVVPHMVRASERALEADSGSARAWLARAATLRIIDPTSRRGVIDATRRALRIDSTSADAWYQLGGALGDSLELRESIDAYRRAAAIDPRHTNALAFLAFDYLWLRDYDSARVWADSAVAVDPTGVLARQASGVARRSLGDWTSAKQEYDVIVRRGTGDDQMEGWAGLAELAWMRGDRRAADSLLARGVAITDTLNPSLHEAAYLGWAFLATGRRETALRILQRFEPRLDAHFQLHLQGDPMLDPLRGDPRFVALLRRGPVLPRTKLP